MYINLKPVRSAVISQICKIPAPLDRTIAIAALVSSLLVFNGALGIAHAQTPEPSPPAKEKYDHGDSQQAMKQRVEDRIKTLHDKLEITSAQEAKWGDVAQVMRDNEAGISQLIQERRQNLQHLTAVDDLQSYENITQAHVDGLKKLIPAFQALYSDMSADQQKDADEAFGRFEGHRGGKAANKNG